MPGRGMHSVPSAARRLSAVEAAELGETAKGLPAGWVLVVEPPFGQLALTPRAAGATNFAVMVADPDRRRVTRDARATEHWRRVDYPTGTLGRRSSPSGRRPDSAA